MADRLIEYRGVEILVWDQSVMCQPRGGGSSWWLKHTVEEADIEGIKRAIDAGRAAMAREIRELRDHEERLLGER